ncbi:hypothetical protein O181_042792 [Austropuccinia psidii MF-1]|uniref:Integrase zinc-binding domain-containing protein n=1 Tax=Austropuccinia psidii MF-1 TaxID=1389203 RepID=A0A9Q3DJB2_9BASI|nr:hypothetical protein [Austropuccinia psidii MF-1]
MNIVHKSGNIHKNSDGLNNWELPNTPDNHAYVPENAEPQILIQGVNMTDLRTEYFEEIRESYKQDKNCHLITSPLDKDSKYEALANSSHDIWKSSYENGRFHLFDFNLYHISKHTCVMVLCSRMLLNKILLECNDNIYSGNLSENRKMKRIKTCAWWASWRKDVIDHCHSCDRGHEANKATCERFGLMIHIKEPSIPWEMAHMNLVTTLPPGSKKSYNACLLIVDRYRKTAIFLPCHKD